MNTPYTTILLKLSGQALANQERHGICPNQLKFYAAELTQAHQLGATIGVVIGGGNFFRGAQAIGIPRVQGDYMGMLATIMNGLALQSALAQKGITSCVMSGIAGAPFCEPYSQHKALECLAQQQIVIFVGGLGSPYFTTDSAAGLRALEIGADVLLKGTRVAGIYTADPAKDPTAQRLDHVSFQDIYARQLHVMDMTAFTLCEENRLPIIVFDINQAGNLCRAIRGESIGTRVSAS